MATHDLQVCFETLKQFILNEKRMRRQILRKGRDKQTKLRRCDEALQALIAIKNFAKLHVEESPEQVMLFDEGELPAVAKRGGY